MSLLSQVTQGRPRPRIRDLVYGEPGVGKSTLAASAPAPIFLPAEDGAVHLDVARLPQPRVWTDVRVAVRALTEEPHEYQTLVVDTLDEVERFVADETVKTYRDEKGRSYDAIAKIPYGKGWEAAIDLCWRPLLADLERLQQKRGMGILFIAHAVLGRGGNAEGADYDLWRPRLQDAAKVSTTGLITGWCDNVLFATWERFTAGEERAKLTSTGRRLLRTQADGPWVAKNRLSLPAVLNLDWAELAAARGGAPAAPPMTTNAPAPRAQQRR